VFISDKNGFSYFNHILIFIHDSYAKLVLAIVEAVHSFFELSVGYIL